MLSTLQNAPDLSEKQEQMPFFVQKTLKDFIGRLEVDKPIESVELASSILKDMEAYLKAEYEKNPVRDMFDNAIPFKDLTTIDDRETLESELTLTPEKKQSYYRNVYHTVYRSFFTSPNPLGDLKAKYTRGYYRSYSQNQEDNIYMLDWKSRMDLSTKSNANRDRLIATGININANILKYIEKIWFTINYLKNELGDGFDEVKPKKTVIRTLASLARAYNYRSSPTDKDVIYDPATEDDRPASIEQIEKYLNRFVQNNFKNTIKMQDLHAPRIKQRFFNEIINNRENPLSIVNAINKMNLVELRKLKLSLTNAQPSLSVENIEDVVKFVQVIQQQYGADQFPVPLQFQSERFENYESFIFYLVKNAFCLYKNEIFTYVEERAAILEKIDAKQKEIEQLFQELNELPMVHAKLALMFDIEAGPAVLTSYELKRKPDTAGSERAQTPAPETQVESRRIRSRVH